LDAERVDERTGGSSPYDDDDDDDEEAVSVSVDHPPCSVKI
jgi:hypothetical protein